MNFVFARRFSPVEIAFALFETVDIHAGAVAALLVEILKKQKHKYLFKSYLLMAILI